MYSTLCWMVLWPSKGSGQFPTGSLGPWNDIFRGQWGGGSMSSDETMVIHVVLSRGMYM